MKMPYFASISARALSWALFGAFTFAVLVFGLPTYIDEVNNNAMYNDTWCTAVDTFIEQTKCLCGKSSCVCYAGYLLVTYNVGNSVGNNATAYAYYGSEPTFAGILSSLQIYIGMSFPCYYRVDDFTVSLYYKKAQVESTLHIIIAFSIVAGVCLLIGVVIEVRKQFWK